jgi:molecular chaperone DnaK (HSP70)
MDDEVEIRIPDVITGSDGRPRAIVRRLDCAEYTALVADLVQRTFKVCDEALQQAGLLAGQLDGVILVGGPTRLPLIRRAVAEYFGQTPKVDVDPDQAVAMGAAIHAATLVGSAEGSVLLDVTPLSLRIGVAGGLAETVIERNTPVPIEQTRVFTTFEDFQEAVRIRIYQGESRSADQNELLGQFTFSGFRRAARGQLRIEVTFEIDTDGIVNVTAREPETGQQASTQITLSSGLSPAQLDAIIAEGKADRVRSEAPGARAPATPGPARAAARAGAAAIPATPPSASASDELEVLPDDAFDLEVDEEFEVVPGSVRVAAREPLEPEALDLMPEGTDLRDLPGPGAAPGAAAPGAPSDVDDLFGDMDDLTSPPDGDAS